MTATLLGEYTLGECVPLAATAKGALDATIGLTLPDVQAKIASVIEAQARLAVTPPSLATQLTSALALVAAIQAQIALGLPVVDAQATALASLLAELQATLAQLQAQVAVSGSLQAVFGVPGVSLLKFEGPASNLGGELIPLTSAGIGGGTGASKTYALVLATPSAAAWEAMKAFFKTL